MLVCGCGSLGAVVGPDVGVGLTVTEHTVLCDTHLWTYHACTSSRVSCLWVFFGCFRRRLAIFLNLFLRIL